MPAPARVEPAFQDMSVYDVLVQGLRAPGTTWRHWRAALRASGTASARPVVSMPRSVDSSFAFLSAASAQSSARSLLQLENARLLLFVLALLLAWVGSTLARPNLTMTDPLLDAAPWLWLGFGLWLLGELLPHVPEIRGAWRNGDALERGAWLARALAVLLLLGGGFRFMQSMGTAPDQARTMALGGLALCGLGIAILATIPWLRNLLRRRYAAAEDDSRPRRATQQQWVLPRQVIQRPWQGLTRLRAGMLLLALFSSFLLWQRSTSNDIEPSGIVLWTLQSLLWAFALLPARWNAFSWIVQRVDTWRRSSWAGTGIFLLGLVYVLAIGTSMLLGRLHETPSEMYSDQVINIIAAQALQQGQHKLYFGPDARENLHVYWFTWLAQQAGRDFDRYTLFLSSALQGLLSIPVFAWLGYEVMHRQKREFALGFGLIAAGFLAGSFWHASVARQGLRIQLGTLFVALAMVFFVRQLRQLRRSDAILAGIFLGLALCSYKSTRMLSAVFLLTQLLALLWGSYSRQQKLQLAGNFIALGIVACAIHLPYLRLLVDDGILFAPRTTHAIYGSAVPANPDILGHFWENVHVFLQNIRNALLVILNTVHLEWTFSDPRNPAVDPLVAALAIVGAGAWIAQILRRRDAALWLVPIAFFAMLLVSAFAIEQPIDVPRISRSHGALPALFLLTALPLALLCRQLVVVLGGRLGRAAALSLFVLALWASYQYNSTLYHGVFATTYRKNTNQHVAIARVIRGFHDSGGSVNNAFILHYPHWLDHRALSIELGIQGWENSFGHPHDAILERLGRHFYSEENYPIVPERDLLFLVKQEDQAALNKLRQLFPEGTMSLIETEFSHQSFVIYRVSALGWDGWQHILESAL